MLGRLADRAGDLDGSPWCFAARSSIGSASQASMPGQAASRTPQRLQRGASLQRIVDDLALRPHGHQGTLPSPTVGELGEFAAEF